MATQSPFLDLDKLAQGFATTMAPPDWAVAEVQRRIVLLLNHVLGQEQEATSRLRRQQGHVVLIQWRAFSLRLAVTAAGLLELADSGVAADLSLSLTQDLILDIVRAIMRGDKPAIRIEGDVQLAAEVNWLVDNVRWDLEEDLARLIGDVPAHSIGQVARRLSQALEQFVNQPSPADRGQL
jgi:ubiquinone biosynthesis protein UbiJ